MARPRGRPRAGAPTLVSDPPAVSDPGLMTASGRVGTVRTVPIVELLLDRWRKLPPLVADAALAAVVAVVTVMSIHVDDRRDPTEVMTAWAWGLLVAQFVALVWRRRAPLAVALVVGAAGFAYGSANLPDPAINFPMALAVYSVAAFRPRRVSVPFAVAIVAVAAVVLALDKQADAADVVVNYFVGLTSWVVGDTMRGQRERAELLAARRDDAAQRAAADERVRIARDLHDVVAHHISVIAVQAEAAQEVAAADPARASQAMATVSDTARAALGELRRALGVLRSEAGRSPQPQLAAVDDLVDSVRRAGLAVDVRTTGEARPVDGVVGVTAYRVVQEALTNVLRHAPASRARVDLDFCDGALVVTVADDGRGARAAARRGGAGGASRGGSGGGHGLIGMRERVAAVGGELDAGPAPGGGFNVRARLPLPA
jgi:signal transduction histidine kinase